ALHNPVRSTVTPSAIQLLDRLNAEIDERMHRMRLHIERHQPEEVEAPASHPPEHTAFASRLFRHNNLKALREQTGSQQVDELARELGPLHEPIEMLVGVAIDVHRSIVDAASKLPYAKGESKRE